MKIAAVTAACLLAAAEARAPLLKSTDVASADEYVVKMKSNADVDTFSKSFFTKSVFSIGSSFHGFSARLSAEELERVLEDPNTDMVSPNVRVYSTGIIDAKLVYPNVTSTLSSESDACPDQQSDHSWGQARLTTSSRKAGLDVYIHNAKWGEGVEIYVIDTGTLCSHEEFAGRSCTCGPDFSALIGQPADGCADGNGHGTFCSSIAAGNVYGVSKSANLIGVKVMGNMGSGTLCGIVDGFDWVAAEATKTGRPSIASVSLGTQGTNDIVDAAANALAEVVQTAIAAGNSGQMPAYLADTCTGSSPGAAETPVTVGSTDIEDKRSFFSNYGACLDIMAPGSDITGAYSGRNMPTDQYITGSGTSMATPHVAGLMAAMLSVDPSLSPEDLKAKVIADAEAESLDLACEDATGIGDPAAQCEATPNKLLHLEC